MQTTVLELLTDAVEAQLVDAIRAGLPPHHTVQHRIGTNLILMKRIALLFSGPKTQLIDLIGRHDATLRSVLDHRAVDQLRRDLGLREQPDVDRRPPIQATPFILDNGIGGLQTGSSMVPPVNQLLAGASNPSSQPPILFNLDAVPDALPNGMAPTGFFDFDFDLPAYSLEALADPTINLPQLDNMVAPWNGGADMWQL